MRSCDDIDEQALSYAEIKALCAGDPRIREKMDLDVQVAKLKVLRGDFQNQKYRLEDKLLKTFPEEIQKQKTRIAALIFRYYAVLIPVSQGYPALGGRLLTCYSPVRH